MSDDGSNSLKGSHVSGATGTNTTLLGRSVYSDEDNVGFSNALGDIGGEEQVGFAGSNLGVGARGGVAGNRSVAGTITGNSYNVLQTGLVDGRVLGVPATDSGLVTVDNSNLDVRVLEGNYSRSRTT